MAACRLLSVTSVSPIQPDMDSWPSKVSPGATRNHQKFWQSDTGTRASSCLSTTMVDRAGDPDDSGTSQPLNPTRPAAESKHMPPLENSLPRPELELSISCHNDAQRTSTRKLRSAKDEFDLTSPVLGKDDKFISGASGAGDEDASLSGRPPKRARTSSLGQLLDENQAGDARELHTRPPSQSAGSDVTGLQSTMPTRSFPSFRSPETESSSSGNRGVTGSGGKSTPSWWPGTGLKTSGGAAATEGPLPRANFVTDGRGMIPGTALQERDFLFKEPSFFPNMLSSMESAGQTRRGDDAPSSAGSRSVKESERPQAFLDTQEHSLFPRKESSTSRTGNILTAAEETIPRSGAPIFNKKREASFQEAASLYGQQIQRGPLDGGTRGLPFSDPSRSVRFEREMQQVGLLSSPHQPDHRSLGAPPAGNANTIYARILDAAQQSVPGPFSQAGLPSGFHVNHNTSFNFQGHPLPRSSSQPGTNLVQFVGESPNSKAVQPVSNEILRSLFAGNPNAGPPVPPYVPQVPHPDPTRLSLPNLGSLDFLHSLQRQAVAQGTDRYKQPAGTLGHAIGNHPPPPPPPPQDFSLSGARHPSQLSSITDPSSALPRGGGVQQGSLQPSSGLRDFLSPPALKGSSSGDLGQGPTIVPQGPGGGPAVEIPTQLSLQAPAALSPVTVVVEGRSIGRRVCLQDYEDYDTFASAMRMMFDTHIASPLPRARIEGCTLANAIPGYVIAYEDEEGDILLTGDLPWRDFIRVAKQIKIVSSSKISFKPPVGPGQRRQVDFMSGSWTVPGLRTGGACDKPWEQRA